MVLACFSVGAKFIAVAAFPAGVNSESGLMEGNVAVTAGGRNEVNW